MKRTQIQLDERTYEAVRRRAFEQGRSISAVVRECLARALGLEKSKPKPVLEDFSFVGVGHSRQSRQAPVSERHDEALAETLRRKRNQ